MLNNNINQLLDNFNIYKNKYFLVLCFYLKKNNNNNGKEKQNGKNKKRLCLPFYEASTDRNCAVGQNFISHSRQAICGTDVLAQYGKETES